MKLEYLYIDGYKGLKRLKLQFKEQTGAVPVDFLIGCNGSGKSSVLEAVGLIFTRIMQNELPGFIFELKYRMPDGTGIYVNSYNNTSKYQMEKAICGTRKKWENPAAIFYTR